MVCCSASSDDQTEYFVQSTKYQFLRLIRETSVIDLNRTINTTTVFQLAAYFKYAIIIYLFLMGDLCSQALLRFHDCSPDMKSLITYFFFPNGTTYYGNYKLSLCLIVIVIEITS